MIKHSEEFGGPAPRPSSFLAAMMERAATTVSTAHVPGGTRASVRWAALKGAAAVVARTASDIGLQI